MCYAAYSKGDDSLACLHSGNSGGLGVREELYGQWNMDDPGFSEQVNRRVTADHGQGMEIRGEMDEIAATFEEAGLPEGFHQAAAEIFRRMANMEPDETGSVDPNPGCNSR